MEKQQLAGLLLVCVAFFLVMAVFDFTVMHFWVEGWPAGMYKYWIALSFAIIFFGFALSYVCYVFNMPKKYVPAVFLTVILLFVAGLLDLFYFAFTLLTGEPYTFDIWSFQYKILGWWNWTGQILWSSFFIGLLGIVWYYVLKKK